MKRVKDFLNICNAAIFYDYKNIDIIEEINQARRCINNNFIETIPISRIRVILSIRDDVILKINNTDIENNVENIHDLR